MAKRAWTISLPLWKGIATYSCFSIYGFMLDPGDEIHLCARNFFAVQPLTSTLRLIATGCSKPKDVKTIAECEWLFRLGKAHILKSALVERHKSTSADLPFGKQDRPACGPLGLPSPHSVYEPNPAMACSIHEEPGSSI